jgi:acyl-coenzyme A thioesterase PaaI-like protein
VAPHGLTGRTARSIEMHNKALLAAHCERLERIYLSSACDDDNEAGVRVQEGESEIVTPLHERHYRSDGTLDNASCFKLLDDAAALAVNSVVRDVLVRTENFNVRYAHVAPAGELVARGRLLGLSEDQYLAESVLVDSEGREVCRGAGAFVRGATALTDE